MLNKLAKLREERAEGEDHGFTLIELLVVVVIIGVLVAIAIPLYLNYRKGAQNRSAQSDVRNAVSAVEQCIGDNAGKAPTSAANNSSTGGSVYLSCTSAGAGKTETAAVTGGQTLNVSDGVTLTYTQLTNTTYSVAGQYTGGTTYTYNSATGKTT